MRTGAAVRVLVAEGALLVLSVLRGWTPIAVIAGVMMLGVLTLLGVTARQRRTDLTRRE